MGTLIQQVEISEAIATKYPEQVVAITSIDRNGTPNAMIAGWSMNTSGDPPMLAVSVGHTRFSHDLIRERGEFVLAFPSTEVEEQVRFCGSNSGSEYENKLAACGWETLPAKHVSPPLLSGCVANFECIVKVDVKTGDHTIFAGEVVAAHEAQDNLERLYNIGDRVFRAVVAK